MLQRTYHEDLGEGKLFTTVDDAELEHLGDSCRENTFPRHNAAPKMKRWTRGNTKIGPALEVAVTHHQGRYGIEIMIQSLLNDGTCSWVMIVNGINKHVTEMTKETQDEHITLEKNTRKPVAKTRPKQTSIPTTSLTASLPYNQRDRIAVEPSPIDKSCFDVSKQLSNYQNLGTDVSFRICVCCVLVNSTNLNTQTPEHLNT